MPKRVEAAMPAREFGLNLWHLLDQRGLEASDLAAAVGVSVNTVYSWLNGRNFPQMGLLWGLRRALRCTWGDLLG